MKTSHYGDFETSGKLIDGSEFARRLKVEPENHYIGEPMTVKGIEGRVIGIYPHFLELATQNYNMSVSYKDLLLGGI